MELAEAKSIVCARVANRCRDVAETNLLSGMDVWVAGGALIRDGNDVDLFAADGWSVVIPRIAGCANVAVKSQTKNATTIKIGETLYQLCDYKKQTLLELITSFDFAHCQIGCCAKFDGAGVIASGVEWTEQFALSRQVASSWFVGSEFPLSSLIRAAKYRTSGILTTGAHIRAVIDILAAVVRRGFVGYEDFKNQLDAVDLGLVPEEFNEVGRSDLMDLFKMLNKG